MVAHDLRMTKYVDKVIQMVDGRVTRILEDQAKIGLLANTSSFEAAEATSQELDPRLMMPVLMQRVPAYAL